MGRLAGKSVHGYDVFISKLRRTDYESCDTADVLKVYTMHSDLCWKERTRSPGVLYLIDIQGITIAHALINMNLAVLMHIVHYLQVSGVPATIV